MTLTPLRGGAGARCSRAVSPPRGRHDVDLADAHGLVLAEDVTTRRAGAAVREHRDGRLRRPGGRHRRRDRRGTRSGCASSVTCRPGTAPDRAVGPGEAIRIMTGAPMPDGRRRGRDGRAHPPRRRRRGAASSTAAPPGDHVRAAGGDLAAGAPVFPAGTVRAAGPRRGAGQHRRRPGAGRAPGPGRRALDRVTS